MIGITAVNEYLFDISQDERVVLILGGKARIYGESFTSNSVF